MVGRERELTLLTVVWLLSEESADGAWSHQPMLSQSCQFSLTTAVDQCQPSVGVPDSLFEDWVGQPDETDV